MESCAKSTYVLLWKFTVCCSVTVVMCAGTQQPISDEKLRIAALRAIFPGMHVSLDTNKKIDDSWPRNSEPDETFFPDALANAPVYRVNGRPMNGVEEGTSDYLGTQKFSQQRQIRFQLFQWPNEKTGLLVILQYDFSGAVPSGSFGSIGLLVHLRKKVNVWKPQEEYLFETGHHSSLQRIEVVDVTGDGIADLIVDSNWGGAETIGSSLEIFKLSGGHFEILLSAISRIEEGNRDKYTQVLDLAKTLKSQGQQFCFSKTTSHEEGHSFNPPRLTYPCYKPGDGVDLKEIRERNEMLTPFSSIQQKAFKR